MSIREPWERYYNDVVWQLKKDRLWEKVIRKFPPKALRSAVKRIYERFGSQEAADHFDWGAAFGNILDYETIDDFIKDLEARGLIPPSPPLEVTKATEEEVIAKQASYLEAQLMSLIEDAKDVSPEILKRVREQIAEALGQVEDIDRLYLEVSRLKEEARRERAKAREYKAKTQELEKELRKLYEEISALRQQLEEAKKAQKRYVYKMVALKAVSHIPSFVGSDMKIYGPFEAGQIFNVPEKDAYTLISRGLAQPWKPTAFTPEIPKAPKIPKEEIKAKATQLWNEYINASLAYEPTKAMQIARQLRELRKQLFS